MHTLRTRIGIRVCVNWVRKAARLDRQSFAKSLSSGPEPQAGRHRNRRRNPSGPEVRYGSTKQSVAAAAIVDAVSDARKIVDRGREVFPAVVRD
jgi:hypothetical protein